MPQTKLVLNQLIEKHKKAILEKHLSKIASDSLADELRDQAENDPELLARKQDYEHKEAKHQARLEYANKIYKIIKNWLIFVAIIIVISSFSLHNRDFVFKLSPTIVITLLTTTTGIILGLFGLVIGWLFPKAKIK